MKLCIAEIREFEAMTGLLPDIGGVGTYRTLLPWEHGRYAEHLLRLSPRDRRTRFLGAVGDTFIHDHARSVLVSARAKVIGWFHDGILRGAAEVVWDENHAAEAAFSVEAMHRKQGVGTALARRAMRAARNRGIATLTILTESENLAMRRLGRKFGARFVIDGRTVEGAIEAGRRDPLSIVFEIAEEREGLVFAAQRAWLDLLQSAATALLPGRPVSSGQASQRMQG